MYVISAILQDVPEVLFYVRKAEERNEAPPTFFEFFYSEVLRHKQIDANIRLNEKIHELKQALAGKENANGHG